MDEQRLRALLAEVATGAQSIESALAHLKHFSLQDLGRLQLDHHRELRQGFPEVIYGAGKTLADLEQAITAQLAAGSQVVVTRCDPAYAITLLARFPQLRHEAAAALLLSEAAHPPTLDVTVLVIAAGTADLPVASEAAAIARLAGCRVETLWDAGVAGIHRLTARADLLQTADLAIVVAGMEGALPSVVGGLIDLPLIAVPTSTGYGTGLHGYVAMLTMLNSCAAGTVVVNIDNGFGAGFFAGRLARQIAKQRAAS